jgi:membrane dipeptidase
LHKRYLKEKHLFQIDGQLDVDYPKIKKSNVCVQSFAIYVSEYIRYNRKKHIDLQINCFKNIITDLKMGTINTKKDLLAAFQNENTHYGLLSLEGCEGIDESDETIQSLFDRGLRCLSLTWNQSNWAADGALDEFNGGMTHRGVQFVKKCEKKGIALDASHLSVQSFWDLVRISQKPFLCSHSNSNTICNHLRNLTDEQIIEIVNMGGVIGITFVPAFLNSSNVSTIEDVIKNINQICELGGENNISFGSDFDGIDQHVVGLNHTGDLSVLYERLCEEFTSDNVEKFTWGNAYSYFSKTLPEN